MASRTLGDRRLEARGVQVSVVVTLLAAALFAGGSVALTPHERDCSQTPIATACSGHGEIVVSGSNHSSSHKSRARSAAADPVRNIACSSGAARKVQFADAAFAAADCGIAGPTCTKAAASDGRPRAAGLTLRRQADGSWQYEGWTCMVTGPPQVTAAMVRDHASRLIPQAAIGLAPQHATLVNIETVMWVDATSPNALPAVTILGRGVRITIRLAHVNWDFGDGDHLASIGPGKRYDERRHPCDTKLCPDYFGHVYIRTGTMSISATASWTATFTVDGGQPVAIPGTVTGPTAGAAIHVKQARGVLVPNPGQD
jgi:hypothetical protein